MMQASSPLAALQPQQPFGHAHGHWNFRLDRPGCGSNFNFRDLSMQHSRHASSRDYFTARPVHQRGSSPAANLAVDLSQNFHIDQSPHFPTPRRCLFDAAGNADQTDPMSTPPLPATSPCPEIEMDASPLPHKAPFSAQVTVQSPTPEPTPVVEDEPMTDSPVAMPHSPLETLRLPPLIRKRFTRPDPIRPTLSKTKAYSHCGAPLRSAPLDRTFVFGSVSGTGSARRTTPLMTLDEAFMDSPEKGDGDLPSDSMSVDATPVAAVRPRSANQNRMFGSPLNGSPIGALCRRPGAVFKKPRREFRRSNSMFEHPDKWISELKTEMACETIDEVDSQPELVLPHFTKDGESVPRIGHQTLIDVMDGKYSSDFDAIRVVDCRFEYEFDGGHIEGAENCTDKEKFASSFWTSSVPAKRTLVIFHCEYSAQRAPMTAMHFRKKDRNMNAHRYPHLSYPEVYILQGGYSSFFQQHKSRCFPQNYIAMDDSKHAEACERGLGRMKQQRAKLSRAQTFAFGEREHSIEESPTALPRNMTLQVTHEASGLVTSTSSTSLHSLSSVGAAPKRMVAMRSVSH